MSQNRLVAVGVGFFVLTLVLVGLLYQISDPGQVEAVPLPDRGPLEARPVPISPTPPPMPTPRPPPVAAPAPQPEAENVPVEVRQDYNYAMQDAIKEAVQQCVDPWMAEMPEDTPPVTFVMDAVVTDGELTDISLRGIGDVPDDVMDCAREAGWAVDWPSWDGKGELRFQNTFTAKP